MFRKLLSNFSWLSLDRIIRSVGTLTVGILVARYLGPDDLGRLSYAFAFVYFFTFLADLGLQPIVIRELKAAPERAPDILFTAFVMKGIGALVAIAACIGMAAWLTPVSLDATTMIFVLSLAFIFQAFDFISYYFQSELEAKKIVIAQNAAFVVSATVKLYLIFTEQAVFWFATTALLEAIVVTVLLVRVFRKSGQAEKPRSFRMDIARQLLASSWPICLSAFLISIHMRLDQVMIANFLSESEVAWYNIAARLTEFVMFFPLALTNTLTPYLMEVFKSSQEEFNSRLTQIYSYMFWGAIAVAVIVTLTGEWFIVLLLGEPFRPAYGALVISIWTCLFISQGLARGLWLLAHDIMKYRLFNNLFAVAINITGNILLIPRMGIAGAALATVLSQGLTLWLVSFLWKPMWESNIQLFKSIDPRWMLRKVPR